jgi:predicted RNase H-like HicB family nuclease
VGIYIKGLDFYPAMVSRRGRFFQADFVDIPGCRAYGATAIEVEINARRALGVHMVTLGRYGRTLPTPSVVNDRGISDGHYLVYIEGPERIGADGLELEAA